jgi:hypothetical protein
MGRIMPRNNIAGRRRATKAARPPKERSRMKIQVTQHHIDTGLRGSCTGDPIALAMLEAGYEEPWVSPVRIVWTDRFAHPYDTATPESVLEFMTTFDNGGYVRPFEFELEGA